MSALDTVGADLLDNPVWATLTGSHARFAQTVGQATRFDPEVALFAALAPGADDTAWADLAALAGPGGLVSLTGTLPPLPDWPVTWNTDGVQLLGTDVHGADDPEAVLLTADDVPEMLDLVQRTRPGPFLRRTIELGTYLGIRRGGALVAMAGERLQPPGWTEISAVCTDPAHRGQGLATRLTLAVVAGVRRRGAVPLIHTRIGNTDAIRLYESLGFRLRRRTPFITVSVPDPGAATSEGDPR
ncbi:ribosomal protein S18 acetylase RimI-like enzyme [Allocatelliglobosispora scoriae]|uniref:Ribosomal protein S18 acetylase RimI-like enzyme n=1 Tax=Allocatelliglobosispora scoriae TaxID=643052 RepID=A0A841C2M2_9ACTN|nr:GNAT family N-acetyltransferase [Allocatelliglobosispora scoriae]MBB5874146.1 ribosomal protein S18 acetylase RimI-like enzyme [Allocatelliglobosispora scoriae]